MFTIQPNCIHGHWAQGKYSQKEIFLLSSRQNNKNGNLVTEFKLKVSRIKNW